MNKIVLLTLGAWSLMLTSIFAQSPLASSTINTLRTNATEYGLVPADFDNWIVTDEFKSEHNGITHIYFQQTRDGFPIFNSTLSTAVDSNGKIKHVANRFEALSDLQTIKQDGVADISAIQKVAEYLEIKKPSTIQLQNELKTKKIYQSADFSEEAITVESVFVKNGKQLVLTKQVALYSNEIKEWWQVRINAASGKLVSKNSWTVECKWGDAHDCKDHTHQNTSSPLSNLHPPQNANPTMTNTYEVFALPLLDPNDGARTIVTAPWNNALNASPHGWHDTTGVAGAEFTITRGNNVFAVEDRDANDTPGFSPDGSASLDFIYPLDLNQSPINYQDAAITNLFYWNNIIHDVWYQYGFDEASGNFQEKNYANVGADGDSVNADAQDGSSTNNANFSAPPDGFNGRMQMFEWSVATTITAEVTAPSSVAGNYNAAGAIFGPQTGSFNGTLVDVAPVEGCTPLTNANSVNNNIALIDRGNCSFVDKVLNAQNAGAIATVICNNTNTAVFTMSGTNPAITIPAIMLSQADCATIRTAMPGVELEFTLNGPSTRDSDLDNGVIIHEYGHGISIRLTGGASNSSCLNGDEQMGEGWSDYLALVMTMQTGDARTDGIGIGAYLTGEAPTSNGIRSFPYSTDISLNPLTYDDIKTQVVPHGVGSVWATMLWEMTWDLIDEYGYDSDIYNGTGGNNIAMQLVIDGLKLQPCNPGFIDGRDAILAADQINNAGANQCLIWEAFARRGLGYSAIQGSSGSRADGVEAFDLSPICEPILYLDKSAPLVAEVKSEVCYDLFVNNNTGNTITNLVLTDATPATTFFLTSTSTMGTYSFPNRVLTITQASMATGTNFDAQYKLFTISTDSSELVHFENFDASTLTWTATTGQGNTGFEPTNTNAYRVQSIFVPNEGADNTHYFTSSNITLPAKPIISFWHDYDTESGWDGGYLEVSTNGGSSWSDVGPDMIQNGYNGGLGTSSNPDIAGHPAFTGNSNGYIKTVADLSNYANQTVQFRFVFGSDNNTFSTGWYIDDFIVYDGVTVENIACLTTDQGHNLCDTTSTVILPICGDFILQFVDSDGDGFGDPNATGYACMGATGYSIDNTDCDDTNQNIYPGAIDICDNLDNNCNNMIDEDCNNVGCPDTLIIGIHDIQTYHANLYLESDIIVVPNDVIEYRAGQDIQLNPGFETQQGAYFDAIIAPCPTPMGEEEGSQKQ